MLSGSGGSTAALCSAAMAAPWTPKHGGDMATVQQSMAYQHAVNIGSGIVPAHHHQSTGAASFHVHRSHDYAVQYGNQVAPPGQHHHHHHPQQHHHHHQQQQQQQQQQAVVEAFSATNPWAPTGGQLTSTPRSACINAQVQQVSMYRPMPTPPAQSGGQHRQAAAPASPLPPPQRSPSLGNMSVASVRSQPPLPPPAAPAPPAAAAHAGMSMVMMPVSMSANPPLAAYPHQHQHQPSAIVPPHAQCLSHSSPERPAFFHNVPTVSIHQQSSNSMLFHEPITQKQRTRPLRDWILAHRSHPYPSRDDKLGLAMLTHMRVDQVTMWFANTRRQIRRIGMKAWSGGLYETALPYRIGNGAIIPPTSDDGASGDEDSAGSLSLGDSSSHVPTDSSGSLD